MPLAEEKDLVNLMEFGDVPQPKKKKNEDDEKENEWLPHWKKEININLVADHNNYPTNVAGSIPPEISKSLKPHWDQRQIKGYEPIIYVSDFWCLKKDMMLLNDTLDGTSLNLTLNLQPYSPLIYQFQKTMIWKFEAMKEQGLETLDPDEMKRMLVETDSRLLIVTAIVTVLHSVFEVLAFKNDI